MISLKIDWFDLLPVQWTQESSLAPPFEGIDSSVLCLLYGPAFTTVRNTQNFKYLTILANLASTLTSPMPTSAFQNRFGHADTCRGYAYFASAWVHVQSCLTLYNPMDWSLPGSSVRRIFQARILERVGIPFSRGSS